MNILGIIAEYNPFHNGHLYHIKESKAITKSKYAICVMSGNFVQRGEPALMDKWTRAEIALLNGADLVIELPTLYSISSAENFCSGAVKLLDKLRIVTNLSFGSEVGNLTILDKLANVFVHEPKEYVSLLRYELAKGLSFPKAREKAALLYLGDMMQFGNVLSDPNNILAIEYIKSLIRIHSSIKPVTIKREYVDYNSTQINNNFASSSGVREIIKKAVISGDEDFQDLKSVTPSACHDILLEKIRSGQYILDLSAYEKQIIYTLRRSTLSDIRNLPEVEEGLEATIKQAANYCNNIENLIKNIKSKRFTQTRINRILLYALLGITKKDMEMSKRIIPYIRVLGFNQNGKEILSAINKYCPNLKIITSVKKFIDSNTNSNLQRLLDIDITATDIYTTGFRKNFFGSLDYTKRVIDI